MDRKYIDQNQIGIKYLRGTLSPEQVEAFEIYMLENPDIIDELQLDEMLSTTLANDGSGSAAKFDQAAGSYQTAWWAKWLGIGPIPIVTSFLLGGLVTGLLGFSITDHRAAQVAYLYASRSVDSNEPVPVFDIAAQSGGAWVNENLVLVIDSGYQPSTSAEVTLFKLAESDDQAPIKVGEFELLANASGEILVTLPYKQLEQSLYSLDVGTVGETKSFRFRLALK